MLVRIAAPRIREILFGLSRPLHEGMEEGSPFVSERENEVQRPVLRQGTLQTRQTQEGVVPWMRVR